MAKVIWGSVVMTSAMWLVLSFMLYYTEEKIRHTLREPMGKLLAQWEELIETSRDVQIDSWRVDNEEYESIARRYTEIAIEIRTRRILWIRWRIWRPDVQAELDSLQEIFIE